MNDQLEMLNAEAVDYQIDIAGMGARAHAFTIDWHIRLLLALAWFIAVSFVFSWDAVWDLFSQVGEDGTTSSFEFLFLVVPTMVFYFLYHPVLEIAMKGRTPGKRMAGVRLVSQTGHSPGAGALLVRNLFRLLDGLPGLYIVGLIAVGITRNSVRIGDLAAGLVLVYDHEVGKKQLDAATRLALDGSIAVEQQELLLELVERWKSLDIESRIRLGEAMLKKIGGQFLETTAKPPEISEKTYSAAIIDELQRVARLS